MGLVSFHPRGGLGVFPTPTSNRASGDSRSPKPLFLDVSGGPFWPRYIRHYIRTTTTPQLDDNELPTVRWWVVALDHMKPRRGAPRPATHGRGVSTDDAGKSAIIDATTLDLARFTSSGMIDGV